MKSNDEVCPSGTRNLQSKTDLAKLRKSELFMFLLPEQWEPTLNSQPALVVMVVALKSPTTVSHVRGTG